MVSEHMDRRILTGTLVALSLVAVAASCARQAVVESGPSGPGEVSGTTQSALMADLRRLATQQEVFRAENARYSLDLATLAYEPHTGVVVDILEATETGFSAIATTGGGEVECAYYAGDVRAPRGYVTSPGEVFCRG